MVTRMVVLLSEMQYEGPWSILPTTRRTPDRTSYQPGAELAVCDTEISPLGIPLTKLVSLNLAIRRGSIS